VTIAYLYPYIQSHIDILYQIRFNWYTYISPFVTKKLILIVIVISALHLLELEVELVLNLN